MAARPAAAAYPLENRSGIRQRYCSGMKSSAKSSITLAADELRLVLALQAKLKARSKVEDVVLPAR